MTAILTVAPGMRSQVRPLRHHPVIGAYADALTDGESEPGDEQRTDDARVIAWVKRHPRCGLRLRLQEQPVTSAFELRHVSNPERRLVLLSIDVGRQFPSLAWNVHVDRTRSYVWAMVLGAMLQLHGDHRRLRPGPAHPLGCAWGLALAAARRRRASVSRPLPRRAGAVVDPR
jgi:hypothetical protein